MKVFVHCIGEGDGEYLELWHHLFIGNTSCWYGIEYDGDKWIAYFEDDADGVEHTIADGEYEYCSAVLGGFLFGKLGIRAY